MPNTKPVDAAPRTEHEDTLIALGARVRELRARRSLTLEGLSDITGLSSSMISLVERGRTSPSIGTLVAIAAGLGVSIPDLFSNLPSSEDNLVTRLEDQRVVESNPGYTRRLLKFDRANQTEFSVLFFEPGASNHRRPSSHQGIEYGVVVQGELTVEVDGAAHTLSPGDAISFSSAESHRIVNGSDEEVMAVWINVGMF